MTTQDETLEGPDESNADEFANFAAQADEGPVMMLNLLKFKPGGAEGYATYGAAAGPIVQKFGGKGLFAGQPSEMLLGDKAYDWDMMVFDGVAEAEESLGHDDVRRVSGRVASAWR